MESSLHPIAVGAQYEDRSGTLVRVRDIWVDEDGQTQIVTFEENEETATGYAQNKSVSKEDFVDATQSQTLQRVNTDHEAWEWRQQ